mgnify:CR=1 FL=1
MQRKPEDRFASAGELAQALRAAWNTPQPPIHAMPTTVSKNDSGCVESRSTRRTYGAMSL